jgi:hypothetical protein
MITALATAALMAAIPAVVNRNESGYADRVCKTVFSLGSQGNNSILAQKPSRDDVATKLLHAAPSR